MPLWHCIDDLAADIILALSDEQILGLPHDIPLEELIRRFPEIYEACRIARISADMPGGEG